MQPPGGGPRPGEAPGPAAQGTEDTVPPQAPPPDLRDSFKQIGAAGRAGLSAANDASKAFRSLVSADISLARSAMGRALAFTGVAVAFGASAWLLLMAMVVVVLSQYAHLHWALSLLITALVSVGITAYAAWRAMQYFEHTRLRATRRQLARLGFGELADYTPDPGSPESTREATERLAQQADKGPIKNDQGIDVTPP